MLMNIHEIDMERRRLGLSQLELARRAGVRASVYYRAASGKTRPRAATLAAWEKALGKARPPRPASSLDDLIRATYRGWAAHFAGKLGVEVEAALNSDPSLRANASPAWAAAARVRELAVYCTVTELDLNGAKVARAIGVTRAAVSLMLRRVEDIRDDRATSEMIEAAARLISGREG